MIGQSLSHFRITAKLGEGGMGEVYRAEDTKLGREVAIKVLPESFTRDPERLARFERESKVLAALNHPNIAAIYEVGEADGRHFLAMELADGDDLAARLAGGAIAIEEAVPIALQIAQALEAAHEGGIVHRDLKPANVKVADGGQVKVLDFGLAKAWSDDASRPDLSMSPTLTAQMTQAGVILGTAAYMAPEQAKGKAVDRRADIWAFGVVLWEMLTGNRLFAGGSTSEVLAAVLMSRPDLDALPARTPARIRRLLERCLRQEPGSRLRDIGDARIVLEEALATREWTLEPEVPGEAPSRRPRPAAAALLVAAGLVLGLVLALAGAALLPGRGRGGPAEVKRLAIPLPPTLRVAADSQLTPDGRAAVFQAIDIDPEADHRPRLYVRPLDRDELLEVERSAGVVTHSLSPDGDWLVFAAPPQASSGRMQLLKVPLDLSAPPLEIGDWPPDATRLLWVTDDTLLAVGLDLLTPLDAGGGPRGEPVRLANAVDVGPTGVLPGGRHVLASWAGFESGEYRESVVAIDWRTGEVTKLVDHGSWPRLAPGGRLLFGRRDKLLAVPFDAAKLAVTGGAVSLMDGLWSQGLWGGPDVSISANGHLLYKMGGAQGEARTIAYLDENGAATPWSADRLHFNWIAVSPDGRWLAAGVDNISQGDALLQVRVSPLDRPRLTTVGTMPGRDCDSFAWSPDSRQIAFSCQNDETANLYTAEVDPASAPTLHYEDRDAAILTPIGFTADSSHVVVKRRLSSADSDELLAVPLAGDGEPKVERLDVGDSRTTLANLSPDGRWLATVSVEAGRRELFVRRLLGPASVGPRALALSDAPRGIYWSRAVRDGAYRMILYRDEAIYALGVTGDATPRFSEPEKLPIDPWAAGVRDLDELPDGRWIGILRPDTEVGAADLRLALDWGVP